MNREDIMNMSINDCIRLLEQKDAEIDRLKRKVESLGKKCNKYAKKLTIMHFCGEENIPKKDKNHNNNTNRTFAGSDFYCGFYAMVENGEFVIGEERGREGGVLYRGEYKGDDTPWMHEIKRENIKLYNSIVKYYGH